MKKNLIVIVFFLCISSLFVHLSAQSYHYTQGFETNVDGDGWFFSNTSTSTSNNNGLYDGALGLKMNDQAYIQTPYLPNSIKLYFYYKAKLYKEALEGSLLVSKSTDDGSTWTELKTINVSEVMPFTLDSIDINETGPCMVRFSYTKVAGLFYLDDIAMTKVAEQIATDNVDVAGITSSCMSVFNEKIDFEAKNDTVFLANAEIGFDDVCQLSCEAFSPLATVEVLKMADPLPGKRDTAIFRITSEDQSKTANYQAIVSRSLYMSLMGFPSEITNGTASYNGWTFAGKRYPSSSKGNGGTYPGEKAMRIYYSSAGDEGQITTPQYSKVKSISFVAKFSKSDGESLLLQKSYDGTSFTTIKTYTPGVEIPSYSTEDAADTLSSVQTVDINDEQVYLRFQYVAGNSTASRTMIDDIAIEAEYDYTAAYDIFFNVFDFDNQPVEGAQVKFGALSATTDASGEAYFLGLPASSITSYTISKTDYFTKVDSMRVLANETKKVLLLQEELEIFLASGQSNMAGRGEIGPYTAPIDGAYLLNDDDEWIPAKNPMNLYSNIRKDADMQKVGPSYTFSETMAKYLDKRVCIIVNAKGGTHIREFIEGGAYHEALMDRLTKANDYGMVKAMIWHQGESGNSTYGSYLSNLNGLVTKLRAAVNNDFYFVAGQLGPWYDKYKGFNDNLVNITSEIENADYVANTNLWHLGDDTHFNTESQLLYGRRYAKNVLAAVYDIDIAVFKVGIVGEAFVTVAADTLSEAGSFTSLWDEQSTFDIHAPQGKVFEKLMIDSVEVPEAKGLEVFSYTPSSTDAYIHLTATTVDTTSTALFEATSSKVVLYPNPSTGQLTLSGSYDSYDVSIFDLSGRLALRASEVSTLDVSSLKKGCYMLHIKSGNMSTNEKLILE